MPTIEFRNITKKFGRKVALNDLSFKVNDGEFVVIVGHTGAGKTTLLRLLAGLIKPTSGSILVDGKPVDHLPPEDRNSAYVPQVYSLFQNKTVMENVTFALKLQGLPEKQVRILGEELLAMVNLYHRPNAYPNELSGGMQQRTALARALAASHAPILLLDEPLRALDARLRLDLRSELRRLARDLKKTVIYVTHDQLEAMALADRVLMLKKGELQQFASPQDLYDLPSNPYVAHFFGEANFLEGQIQQSDSNTVMFTEKSKAFTLELPQSIVPPDIKNVVVAIRPETIRITRSEKSRPNKFHVNIISKRFLGKWISFDLSTTQEDTTTSFHARLPAFKVTDYQQGEQVQAFIITRLARVFAQPENLKESLEVT